MGERYHGLVACFLEAATSTIQFKTNQQFKTKMPTVLKRLIRNRNKAGNRWRIACQEKNLKRESLWKSFKEWQIKVANFRLKRAQDRREKWQEWVIKNGGLHNKQLWQILKPKKNRPLEALQVNGRWVSNVEELKRVIVDFYQKLCTTKGETQTTEITSEGAPCWKSLDGKIEPNEVETALKKLKKDKATGLDNIKTEFLILGGQPVIESLVKLFLDCQENLKTPLE